MLENCQQIELRNLCVLSPYFIPVCRVLNGEQHCYGHAQTNQAFIEPSVKYWDSPFWAEIKLTESRFEAFRFWMSVERMTSKSKSDLDSLETLSVKLNLQHNLCALASVGVKRNWGTRFRCLQPGLQYSPGIPGETVLLFSEHWKSGFQVKGQKSFFRTLRPNRKMGTKSHCGNVQW